MNPLPPHVQFFNDFSRFKIYQWRMYSSLIPLNWVTECLSHCPSFHCLIHLHGFHDLNKQLHYEHCLVNLFFNSIDLGVVYWANSTLVFTGCCENPSKIHSGKCSSPNSIGTYFQSLIFYHHYQFINFQLCKCEITVPVMFYG